MRRLAVFALLLAGCGGSGSESRSFAMGFTPFPYARTLQAVSDTWDVLARDADLVAFHYDDGVPWQAAYDEAPYPSGYQAELDAAAAAAPAGHFRYLAVTPIAFSRDHLADNRTDAGGVALAPPWDGYAFDDPHVVAAFARHCERMIAVFAPDAMAFGVEVNLLAYLAPSKWGAYVSLAGSVYASLKAAHPTLPLSLTIQGDAYYADPATQGIRIAQVLSFTDLMTISAYPYSQNADPAALRPDYFSTLAALAPEKPFAIAETGWPAEDVTLPYPVTLPETPLRQDAYMQFLLSECRRLRAVYINWFLARDYDIWWDAELAALSSAPITRLWRDIGLYAGDGRARPSRDAWRRTLGVPRK